MDEERSPHPAPWESAEDQNGVFIGVNGLRSGWCLLLFLAIASCAYLFLGTILLSIPAIHALIYVAPGKPYTFAALLANDIPLLLAVVAGTWIMSFIEQRPIASYGFAGRKSVSFLLIGSAWGLICLSLLVALLYKEGWLIFDGRPLAGIAVWRYGAMWLIGFALVSVTEEYTMRAYLQSTLARALEGVFEASLGAARARTAGFWAAALLLSFLFGAGHRSNPGESPVGLLSAGLIGLIFCFTLWRTGSLWWALGFHAAWDWAQSFLFGVADSGTMVTGHLFGTHPAGSVLLSGGSTGPEGSFFVLPLLGLIALLVATTLPPARICGDGTAGSVPPSNTSVRIDSR